jgi:hypothetical protein
MPRLQIVSLDCDEEVLDIILDIVATTARSAIAPARDDASRREHRTGIDEPSC